VIERYTLPAMGGVWSEAHKYELWCRVETLVLEANAAAGIVPADSVEPVRAAAAPTPEAVATDARSRDRSASAFLRLSENTDPCGGGIRALRHDLLRPDTAPEATDLLLARAIALVGAARAARHTARRCGRARRPRRAGRLGPPVPTSFAMSRSVQRLSRARTASLWASCWARRHLLQH
jgi:adenylosuccinate lyase